MTIVFYARDFSGQVQFQNLDVYVDRYSINMIGGCNTAKLKVPDNADKWELFKLLRCPVEIYGNDGGLKWWGYVNRVVIPHGKIRVGLGLDEMYNSVIVRYAATSTITTYYDSSTVATDSTNTDLADDNESVLEYSRKSFFISLPGSTQTEAESFRNNFLASHRYPITEMDLSGGSSEIEIECYGWFKSLQWQYYVSADSSSVENTTQISNIITDSGQFFNGTIIESVSGITSVAVRDGANTAMNYIIELLQAGSSNNRPMLCYVDKNRYLHVYERSAETIEYLMREDGNLETLLGRQVEPENCLAAVWVKPKGVPNVLGGLSSIHPFFLEQAEYTERFA